MQDETFATIMKGNHQVLNEARQWSGCQLMNTLLLSDSLKKKKKLLSSHNVFFSPFLQACPFTGRGAPPAMDTTVQGPAMNKYPGL